MPLMLKSWLQSNQWNYGQYFIYISLHPINQIIKQVACPQTISFLNTRVKECFEYLAYLLSYTHFIVSIFPRISL